MIIYGNSPRPQGKKRPGFDLHLVIKWSALSVADDEKRQAKRKGKEEEDKENDSDKDGSDDDDDDFTPTKGSIVINEVRLTPAGSIGVSQRWPMGFCTFSEFHQHLPPPSSLTVLR